ncbi:MAG TPA: hypothetical protein VMT51_00965 [Dongiaceae bacterium]|nr:hypothetical protein [Dongiaceae bacterium]
MDDLASVVFFGIPLWLVLFVLAGITLFLLKITSDDKEPGGRSPGVSLRLFLLLATLLLAIAGIVSFYRWVQPE